jgi:hypothetical protein
VPDDELSCRELPPDLHRARARAHREGVGGLALPPLGLRRLPPLRRAASHSCARPRSATAARPRTRP